MSHTNGRRAPVKGLLAILASATMLSACVIAVDTDNDDWDDDYERRQRVSVRLDDGESQKISCPEDYETFVERKNDRIVAFGCKKPDSRSWTDD